MKKILVFIMSIVCFTACDKSDGQLKNNSLSIVEHSFSGCINEEDWTKAAGSSYTTHRIILEAKGNVLHILKQNRFACGAKIELEISNEGNTITIHEVNKGGAAYCTCPAEYTSEITGMKEGVYTICIYPPAESDNWYYQPFVFTFKDGVKETIDLEPSYY